MINSKGCLRRRERADGFRIDAAAGTATCPAGHTASLGQVKADGARTTQFKHLCADCPL
ncbi:hypothetical protein [Streptomyces dysideae]|uniref:hypothetical protein n=1 Tax=Streptomyces dysideae TaxID=909626 RepID=UPI000AA985A4|nr:hypothetical protein [Streptomyces dysideae]